MRFQACTIIARNYLPHARVLYRSFRKFHPDAPFSVLVLDGGRRTINEPFDVFFLKDIDLPEGEEAPGGAEEAAPEAGGDAGTGSEGEPGTTEG